MLVTPPGRSLGRRLQLIRAMFGVAGRAADLARMLHNGASADRRSAWRGSRLDEDVEPCLRMPARRGVGRALARGAGRTRCVLVLYLEATRGEPPGRMLVAAVSRRMPQNCSRINWARQSTSRRSGLSRPICLKRSGGEFRSSAADGGPGCVARRLAGRGKMNRGGIRTVVRPTGLEPVTF